MGLLASVDCRGVCAGRIVELSADFVFVVCQAGAEAAVREEVLRNHDELRLAFSRPGFVTFKCDVDKKPPDRLVLKSMLARTYGWSVGRAVGEDGDALVRQILDCPVLERCDAVHVWERDRKLPGAGGFEPGASVLAAEVGEKIVDAVKSRFPGKEVGLNRVTKADALVFDVCLVEPGEWWFGFHTASSMALRWPGGCPRMDLEQEVVTRAYYKLKEGLLWSQLPVAAGDLCAEIGSAPGGASQLLLETGCEVIGVDPAEMEPVIASQEKFKHIRRRGHEVKKRDFRGVKWLFADINMVPNYTLDTVSDIVAHESVDVKGMLLTLKLTDWKMVQSVPQWMERLRKLGFKYVRPRQLAFNRQEVCLLAAKDRFVIRSGKKR